MNKKFYFNVCKELIYSDLIIFKQTFLDKFIDITIWVVLNILIMGYIMPFFGLSKDFGVFQLGGLIAATGLFELYGSIVEFVSDLEGNRIVSYTLTLPIPSWMAIMSKVTYYFIVYCILSCIMLPIGKICLWNQLNIVDISYYKFFLTIIFQSVFFACFGLWAASIVSNMAKLGNVWSRFIFPMWFMGGFQFSWFSLYSVMPIIAFLNLLNPMIYITEAVRTTILGQAHYINFWVCLLAIASFSTIFLFLGMKNLKKRLDFV